MNKWIVRFMMFFTPLWKRMGVDPGHLEAILTAKLTIDDRRPGTWSQVRQKNRKPARNRGMATVLGSLLMGALYLFVFGLEPDAVSGLTIYFFLFMVMLAMTLIADFTYVLIDVKDNFIILPKPVNAGTILMARLLHILIHLSKIVLPMSLPGMVYFIVTSGWYGGILFEADVVLATLICIFLINSVYLLIMRFTTVERFKDVIGGVQVGFSILVFALYYLGPRLSSTIYFTQASVLSHPYMFAAPPLWLAALWQVLRHPQGQPNTLWMLGAAGLLLSPLSIWAVIRYLAPQFDRKLSALGAGSTGEGGTRSPSGTDAGGGESALRLRLPFYRRVSGWVTRGNAEASGFEVAWLLTGRNRDFKLKVYPSFAYVIVYFLYFTLNHFQHKPAEAPGNGNLLASKSYILLAYLSSFALITAITNLVYSDKYRAAWVYYVSPVSTPGELLIGSVKAMLLKFYVPFFCLVSLAAAIFWGPRVLPDMLLGLVNVIWFGMLMGFVFLKRLPFSAAPNAEGGSGRFLKSLFLLSVPSITAGAHYAMREFLPFQFMYWLFLALSAILAWVIYSRYRELSWSELEVE